MIIMTNKKLILVSYYNHPQGIENDISMKKEDIAKIKPCKRLYLRREKHSGYYQFLNYSFTEKKWYHEYIILEKDLYGSDSVRIIVIEPFDTLHYRYILWRKIKHTLSSLYWDSHIGNHLYEKLAIIAKRDDTIIQQNSQDPMNDILKRYYLSEPTKLCHIIERLLYIKHLTNNIWVKNSNTFSVQQTLDSHNLYTILYLMLTCFDILWKGETAKERFLEFAKQIGESILFDNIILFKTNNAVIKDIHQYHLFLYRIRNNFTHLWFDISLNHQLTYENLLAKKIHWKIHQNSLTSHSNIKLISKWLCDHYTIKWDLLDVLLEWLCNHIKDNLMNYKPTNK